MSQLLNLKINLSDLPDSFYLAFVDERIRTSIFDRAIHNSSGTQKSLANKLGVDRRRLEKWRYGRRHMPINFFNKICAIANICPSSFNGHKISLKAGTFCRIPLIVRFPIQITEEWVWMSQIINTDGHIDPKRKVIEISNIDSGVLEKIRNFCEEVGLNKRSLYEREHNENGILINICNKTLTNIFIQFLGCFYGSKFKDVKISNNILSASNPIISAAIRGAFDGDGWVCVRSRKIGIAMGSEIYVKQVSKILKEKFKISNYVYGPRDNKYMCEISTLKNMKKFRNYINFDNQKRKKNLQKAITLLSQSYKNKFHPGCSQYECLKIIKENPHCTSKQVSQMLNRKNGSMRSILKILRDKNFVFFFKKGKEFKYKISPQGKKYVRDFK